jgi:hypothetical protein
MREPQLGGSPTLLAPNLHVPQEAAPRSWRVVRFRITSQIAFRAGAGYEGTTIVELAYGYRRIDVTGRDSVHCESATGFTFSTSLENAVSQEARRHG